MSTLLKEIVSGPWMIEESAAIGLMPFVHGLISGAPIQQEEVVSETTASATSSEKSEHVVVIVPIKNVITKYSNCGSMGLVRLEKTLNRLDSDKSVDAIILDADTPGGAASYLPNVRKTMESLTTPIFTHYSGLMCSAGYYIGSGTQAIFASTETDIVGSIGTMISFQAANPDKTDPDVVLHTIYADKSENKNKPFREAMKGEYDLIRQSMLNPMNETFHNAVLSGRPGVSKEVLSGSTYMSNKAIELGLIDGVKTLDETIQYVYDVLSGQEQVDLKFNYKLKSNSNMNFFEKVSSIIGREITSMEELTAEEYATVNEKLNVDPETSASIPTITEQINTSVQTAVASALNDLQPGMTSEEITSLIETTVNASVKEAVADAVDAPAAPGADAGPVDGGTEDVPSWENPENPINSYFDDKIL